LSPDLDRLTEAFGRASPAKKPTGKMLKRRY
jgi:hypothetical protein